MKHVKKMRLVECSDTHQQQQPIIQTPAIKDEEFTAPQTLQNLDQEMKNILNDTSTDINQKWFLYNQVLQRYLGFVRRMREGNGSIQGNTQEEHKHEIDWLHNDAPTNHHQSQIFTGPKDTGSTSTPKKDISANDLALLPLRIRKQILRREKKKKMGKLRKSRNSSNAISLLSDSPSLVETGEDDFHDVDDTLSTTLGAVVNGWVDSNIEK